jgi:hypothetical protein
MFPHLIEKYESRFRTGQDYVLPNPYYLSTIACHLILCNQKLCRSKNLQIMIHAKDNIYSASMEDIISNTLFI